MKYELKHTVISSERTTLDENGEPTDNYEVTITLALSPIDTFIPPFSKDIIVVSNNNMTGYQVDVQRNQEIQNFLNLINNG